MTSWKRKIGRTRQYKASFVIPFSQVLEAASNEQSQKSDFYRSYQDDEIRDDVRQKIKMAVYVLTPLIYTIQRSRLDRGC
jgi:hypothetical protein